jgi:hypothetical protein
MKLTTAILKSEAPNMARVFTWSQDMQLGEIFADHTPWLDIASPAKYKTLVEECIDETFSQYRAVATKPELEALDLEATGSTFKDLSPLSGPV